MLPFIGSWDECPGSCLELGAPILFSRNLISPFSPDVIELLVLSAELAMQPKNNSYSAQNAGGALV